MVTKPNGTVVNVDLGLRVVLFLMVTKLFDQMYRPLACLRVVLFLMVTKLMVPGAAGKHGLRVVLF